MSTELGLIKERLDVSKIFLSYLATNGDIVATSNLADCTIDDVLTLSRMEMWDAKLASVQVSRGADAEEAKKKTREINRMALYIQGQRLRGLIDRTIWTLYENGNEALKTFLTEADKKGKSYFSTKPLLDLVKSAEACHALLYRALGDTVAKEDGASGAGITVRDLHMTVIQNLSKATGEPVEPVLRAAEEAHKTDTPTQEIGYLDVNDALSEEKFPSPG